MKNVKPHFDLETRDEAENRLRREGDAWGVTAAALRDALKDLPTEEKARASAHVAKLTLLHDAALLRVGACERELAALRLEVMTDPLTGIPNRRFFDQELEIAVNSARRDYEAANDNRPKRALCMVDLGGLTSINTKLGQAAGDAAIKAGAKILQGLARKGESPSHVGDEDKEARIGGDEYGLLLIDGSGHDDYAQGAKKRLDEQLKGSTFEYNGNHYPLSFYVTVVEIDGTQTPEEVFEVAGTSLYDMKALAKHDRYKVDLTPVSLPLPEAIRT